MRTRILLFLIFISVADSFCQNRNSVWCFGDSAGIDFSSGTPVTFQSGMDSRGSCSSISDSSGNLLFYASVPYRPSWLGGVVKTGGVYNKNHQLMQNGDTIVGESWYHEIIIVPLPANDSLYYVFSVGVAGFYYGLFYAVVNINANNGVGAVIQKNIQVMPDEQVDCINAVKHGNGRDWWVVGRRTTILQNGQSNNEFWKVLVTPTGISVPSFQNIGSMNGTNNGKIVFSPSGDTLLFTNIGDLMEMYNFDRCTGILSNPVTIRPQATVYSEWQWGSEFSPDGRFVYTSTSKDTTHLFQYDLTNVNPVSSRVILYESIFPLYCGGELKRAPDGKIYFSIAYENIVSAYPYPDSIYNIYNMNLSVINYPDSLGAACDFQPYSFYLGGKRTYWGLPNNPDYDLGAVTGSICDSLTGIANNEQGIKNELFVYYNSSWQKAFINAKGLKGKNAKMSVYDLLGNVVYSEDGKLSSQYFTRDLNMAAFAKGMYIVNLITEKERLVKKFIKD